MTLDQFAKLLAQLKQKNPQFDFNAFEIRIDRTPIHSLSINSNGGFFIDLFTAPAEVEDESVG